MLNLYLINEGKNTKLDGAIVYGQMFSIKENVSFFKQSGFGFYNFIMGLNFNIII
jgi:hypothetical protein